MIREFIERWKNCGDEKSYTQKFWLELLRDVLNIEKPEDFVSFEKRVALEHVSYIDAYIPSTRTVIEQKSFDVMFRGSKNQRIIKVQESLKANKVILYDLDNVKGKKEKKQEVYI